MAEITEELQYNLDGYQFGRGTPITVNRLSIGDPATTSTRKPNPRAHGIRFGRTYKQGRTLSFDLNVLNSGDAHGLLDELTWMWSGDEVNELPGEMMVLSWQRAGRIRRVWGRPGRCTPTTGAITRGWVPVTATFDTVNQYFYGEQQTVHTTLVPPTGSAGFTVPFTMPLVFSGESESQGALNIGGYARALLTIQINGPISYPTVTITHTNGARVYIKLNGTINAGDYVRIDPFFGTVMSRYGANWAGAFTADSTPLFDISMPAGVAQTVLRGTDATGTASMDTSWSNTYTSI